VSERRRDVDWAEVREQLDGRCFICALVAGDEEFAHHVVYEDARAIAFLNKYPPLYGYVLVAPRDHREEVTGDFTENEFAELQRVVHRVGEAISRAVPTERLYVCSLGSRQGNRHVHWHLAPLPSGVPFEEQQLAALGRTDVLDLTEAEFAKLAEKIRRELES
jgi:diadenosine tetraphosphate (Ap4A) HIT family hydrolase